MPLDPVAWLVMYGEHQAALADLIAANMRHRLPLEAVRDAPPPAQQVCVGISRNLHSRGLRFLQVQPLSKKQASFSMVSACVSCTQLPLPVHDIVLPAEPVQTR